ncbi:GTPase-activating protein [Pseudoalteromonas sp. CnMc7-15]|uniref:Der GTPase-activating protein YihI n=1 Tax=unclassified Pseudoalteromonas TaxID=194690 RepID=UPI001EF4D714|nr:Der GTPase-activating protein YihI [Pseudoalteromonas sp. CnMc7-15]MCG7566654.1 GTPase-activating protein [Pseudoalteromonas sp. CnMc7-15]
MTRKKKSRKVINNGTARLSKDKLRELRAMKEQRSKKKKKGAEPGNRNSQLLKVEGSESSESGKTDKRVGSKKPVSLTPQAPKQSKPESKPRRNLQPQATLRQAHEPELSPQQELAQIEADERLLALIERHDQGEVLTGKDAKYFNAKVARHEQLCEILGIDDEDYADDEDLLDSYMNDSLADEWLDEEDKK